MRTIEVESVAISPHHFIDGRRVASADKIELRTPITNTPIGEIDKAGAETVDEAVAAAKRAFPDWAALGPEGRRPFLHRYAELIKSRIDDFAIVESTDTGNLRRVVKGRVGPRAAQNITFFADWALKMVGHKAEGGKNNDLIRYQPSGVSALITPFNAPLMLTSWKIGPALAAGNTVVVKPPELSPMSSSMLMDLAAEAGIPTGVLNLVNGDAETGAALVSHPDIARISFTGSPGAAKAIARAAAEHLTPCSFELGGKSPFVVFADADLELAAAGIVRQYTHSGQVCLAGTRILVEEIISEPLQALVLEKVAQLKVGDPRLPETNMGPLISEQQLARVEGFVERAKADGVDVLIGGSNHDAGDLYYQPTIVGNVTRALEIVRNEVFGPVLCWQTFNGEAEAIHMANDTEYGLAGMVFTSNREKGMRVGDAIVAGSIWVNSFYVRNLAAPFGGAKLSGVGREGGNHSFDFFCNIKTLSINEGTFRS
ncbi:MAG: aldehyde dehydrogenase family protein [Chloroflexota bacterium]